MKKLLVFVSCVLFFQSCQNNPRIINAGGTQGEVGVTSTSAADGGGANPSDGREPEDTQGGSGGGGVQSQRKESSSVEPTSVGTEEVEKVETEDSKIENKSFDVLSFKNSISQSCLEEECTDKDIKETDIENLIIEGSQDAKNPVTCTEVQVLDDGMSFTVLKLELAEVGEIDLSNSALVNEGLTQEERNNELVSIIQNYSPSCTKINNDLSELVKSSNAMAANCADAQELGSNINTHTQDIISKYTRNGNLELDSEVVCTESSEVKIQITCVSGKELDECDQPNALAPLSLDEYSNYLKKLILAENEICL